MYSEFCQRCACVECRSKLKYSSAPVSTGTGIALLFHDHGTRRWWVVSIMPRPLYPRERSITHCTGGWVGPTAGLDMCEKSAPSLGIRSPDRPARSQSLYQLSYPGPNLR
jgi:hypothetical protein